MDKTTSFLLVQSLDTACDSDEYQFWMLVLGLPVLVLYVIAIPATMLVAVWRAQRHSHSWYSQNTYGLLVRWAPLLSVERLGLAYGFGGGGWC